MMFSNEKMLKLGDGLSVLVEVVAFIPSQGAYTADPKHIIHTRASALTRAKFTERAVNQPEICCSRGVNAGASQLAPRCAQLGALSKAPAGFGSNMY